MNAAPLLQADTPISVVRCAPRGRILAAGADDGLLALWGFDHNPRALGQVSTGERVVDVLYSPRLSLLVSVGPSHLRGWRIPDLGKTFEWQVGRIDAALFALDGNLALVASEGTMIEVDLRDGQRVRTSAQLADEIVQLANDASGNVVALCRQDGTTSLRRFDGQAMVDVVALDGTPRAFALAPDARCVALADDTVRMIDREGHALFDLPDVVDPCTPAYSAEGRLLLAGGHDGRIAVYDRVRRAAVRVFEGHDGAVRALAMLYGTGSVVSAGADGRVRTWDLRQSRG